MLDIGKLKGKHIIIFGASSGIGQAVAQLSLEHGLITSLAARRKLKLQEIAKDYPSHCYFDSVDITQMTRVNDFIQSAIKTFGPIDYVINCAGVMYYQLMQKRNYNEWITMVETNIIGLLNITHAVINPLITSQGMFINVTSDAGKQAFPGLAVYSGTKAFMEFTLKGLRYELIEHGVRIVNIQPGNVATQLHQHSSDQDAVKQYSSSNNGQFLEAKDIASTIFHAMQQPKNVALNEILIEPQQEPI